MIYQQGRKRNQAKVNTDTSKDTPEKIEWAKNELARILAHVTPDKAKQLIDQIEVGLKTERSVA